MAELPTCGESSERRVVNVSGDIDRGTAPVLEQRLAAGLAGARPVVVDMAEVEFLGVAGLEVLADADSRARAQGTSLHVVRPPRDVGRALSAAGLHHLLRLSPLST
ncbi:STAS domain-containing protein [Actinophytocola sp. NPDC049390]|uniref:STAS domain-containing protein n=1 Tax=Actinophytocola sp. NPDC049390 TaxID=3363894 RepID=UPI00379A797D